MTGSLTTEARRLYARQLLLREIGSAGQEKLCASKVSFPANADPEARRVAQIYLERAGVFASPSDEAFLCEPMPSALDATTGGERLAPPLGALAGAFAAVETLKRILRVGTPAKLPF